MAMTMMGTGIRVSDLDRSTAFYRDVLGMVESGRFEFPGMTEVLLKCTDVPEEGAIILVAQAADTSPIEIGTGFGRFAFFVPDARAVRRQLLDAGFEADDPVEFDGGVATIVFGTDPDGYRLEFIQVGQAGS